MEFQEFAAPDPAGMRVTLGRFLTGVAVVTAEHEGQKVGMTINSLTSISLEPPILMISLSLGARTVDALAAERRFGISILGIKQESVARSFAVRGGTRFDDGVFDVTPGGLPVVSGALAQAECLVVESLRVGDHQVFFGEVASARYRDGHPLAFFAGKFGGFRDVNHDAMPWVY